MEDKKIGEIVTGLYKTGKYIGEITDIRQMHYLVKVKAVLKHPQQGDLHNPREADVQFFHERRALAFNEQTNIPKQMVKPFEGPIPDYKESLKHALDTLKDELVQLDTSWAQKSLDSLSTLEADYFLNNK
jgi:kinase-associated protein B